MIHHVRPIFHDGLTGGEEFAEFRGGVFRDPWSGRLVKGGGKRSCAHPGGELLLGG